MKIYIRRGANVNYVNANGDTPLIAAAYSGKLVKSRNQIVQLWTYAEMLEEMYREA